MGLLVNAIIGFLYLCVSFAIYFYMHMIDGHSIVEAGYRSQQMYKKIRHRAKGQSYWDFLSYWSLCKNAKKNQKAVWIFFSIHLLPLVASPVSIILWPAMLFSDLETQFYVQLCFVWAVLDIHTVCHIVVDDKYLPSERKRRHLLRDMKEHYRNKRDK